MSETLLTWWPDDSGEQQVLLAAVAIVLSLVPALVWIARNTRRLLLRSVARGTSRDYRRYVAWYAGLHGTLHNVYLDRDEKLSLANTFVPLNALSEADEQRTPAIDALSNLQMRKLILLGDPGSGKSTLLRAFGATVMSGRSTDRPESLREYAAVFIPLRDLARYLRDDGAGETRSVKSFIVDVIFARQAGLRTPKRSFETWSKDNGIIYMLDGLDEVPDSQYREVRQKIIELAGESNARLILTCRRENFRRLRPDWIPVLTSTTHVLAPLQDHEILTFIQRREQDLGAGKSAASLFENIRQSDTLELHRTPLVLTISISLYVHIVGYTIPRSITQFYEVMIRELLTRHDFRLDANGSINTFSQEDKYRFLRDFAYGEPEGVDPFADFSLRDLVIAAAEAADGLVTVNHGDAESFVNEIIDRSGLIARSSDESYIFAHRSIQEYFMSRRLLQDPAAAVSIVLEKCDVPLWRQVVVMFCATDHPHVGATLAGLRRRSLELCARCTAATLSVDRDFVAELLIALSGGYRELSGTSVLVSSHASVARSSLLGGLIALTRSPLSWVRSEAVNALVAELEFAVGTDIEEFSAVDPDTIIDLLLAVSDPKHARTVARVEVCHALGLLAPLVERDRRSINPLWRLLWVMEPSRAHEATISICTTLLRLARTPEGLHELNSQPPSTGTSDFTPDRVYPFRHALPPGSNLVAVLAALEMHDVSRRAPHISSFVDACLMNGDDFRRLEKDYERYGPQEVRLFWPARVLAALGGLMVVAAGVVQIQRGSLPTSSILTYGLLGAVPLIVLCALSRVQKSSSVISFAQDPHHHAEPEFIAWNVPRLRTASQAGFDLKGSSPPDTSSPDDLPHRRILSKEGRRLVEIKTAHRRRAANPVFSAARAAATDRTIAVNWFLRSLTIAVPWLLTLAGTVAVPLAWAILVPGLAALASSVGVLCFWLPLLRLCQEDHTWRLNKNRYANLYSDPECSHWLIPSSPVV